MPIFHGYVMVDWSAKNSRGSGQDSIWIAHGFGTDAQPTTTNPRSRTEATRIVRQLLVTYVATGRALVCFDVPYGLPRGFAGVLPGAQAQAHWARVWSYLSQNVGDDIGSRPGRLPNNCNDRFSVANAMNTLASPATGPDGPFFSKPNPPPSCSTRVPFPSPAFPFSMANGVALRAMRAADVAANSDTAFRLFGQGSVGGQAIVGIPRLHALRFDSQLAATSRVWPFETGWADASGAWLEPDVRVVHAEIYPSVRAPLPDTINDRGQVRAMWTWARDLDRQDQLAHCFGLPPNVRRGGAEDQIIRGEEGWILGIP